MLSYIILRSNETDIFRFLDIYFIATVEVLHPGRIITLNASYDDLPTTINRFRMRQLFSATP